MSSASSLRPRKSNAAYALSKMALDRLTVLLAAEVAERGIRLNAVCPGPILSDRVIDERIIDPITAEQRTAEEVKQEVLQDMPLARYYGEIPPVAAVCRCGELSDQRRGQVHYRRHSAGRRRQVAGGDVALFGKRLKRSEQTT